MWKRERRMGKLCDRWETGGVVGHGEGPHHCNESVSKAVKAPRASGVPAELCSLSFSWLRAMLERKDAAWDKGSSHRSPCVCESSAENKCSVEIHMAQITFVLHTVCFLCYSATPLENTHLLRSMYCVSQIAQFTRAHTQSTTEQVPANHTKTE